MPIIIGRRAILGDVTGILACLESLVSDIERFGSGEISANPAGICRWSAHELEAAPLLGPYAIWTRTLPCLVGGNGGRPILKGRVITTSDVWIMTPDFGWARTYSRLYRLGGPARSRGQS